MREARIILPVADNDGREVAPAHTWLAHALIDAFGGFTALQVQGAWKSPDGRLMTDPGIAYDVAMDDTAENAARVAMIAVTAGSMARQESVFARYPSGDVNILQSKEHVASIAVN